MQFGIRRSAVQFTSLAQQGNLIRGVEEQENT